MNTDLFGREVFDPIRGDQMPLFHEPVQIDRPQNVSDADRRIARKFDPRHTGDLYASQPINR